MTAQTGLTPTDIRRAMKVAEKEGMGIRMNPDGSLTIVDITPASKPAGELVYFISCGEFVKIGRSSEPAKRLANMRTGNPYDLTIIRTVQGMEREFHRRFSACHHRDEWFRFEGELKAWLESELVE